MRASWDTCDLPELLRAARKRHGHSQQQAAEAIGVSVSAVQKWESGIRIPRVSLVRRAVKAYIEGPQAEPGRQCPGLTTGEHAHD